MESIPAEVSARISALEAKVAELYRHLELVEPAAADAVAASLPPEAVELARAGDREGAMRVLIETEGLSTQGAMNRVDGYLRSIGH